MARKEYYTRCSCPAGKLSAPGGPEYLVAHIHLPPRDNPDDFLPPSHVDIMRKNPGVPCQCSTERTRLPGRPDIIGVHFHGLSPKSTGNRESSTLPEDTTNSNTSEERDFHWAVLVQKTQDPQFFRIQETLGLCSRWPQLVLLSVIGAAAMFFSSHSCGRSSRCRKHSLLGLEDGKCG
ncbi:hypothetical protein GE21DRAFT_1280186 [Neurospora crassa]|nr:hypothetical protein GE21DRAFT_1280186 [Neurospora crassa]